MNEQEQAQFIQWLKQKVGNDDQKLKQVLAQLQGNKEAMAKAYQQFTQEGGQGAEQGTEQPSYKRGGKLSYIDCLKQFKKGGTMDCGCNKKVPKGQGGLAMMVGKSATLVPKLAGLAKSAPKVLSFGQKALKFGMDNKNTIMNVAQTGMNVAKSLKGLKSTDSSVVTPSAGNDYYGANAGAIQSPQMLSMQRQVPIFTGNDIPDGGIVNKPPTQPKLIEKGGKLKKKKLAEGGILVADKGARLARREDRQDHRAERQLDRKDRRLVKEYNYRGTSTGNPGETERPRNRFDEGAEALIRTKQPLGIVDNLDPMRNKNMEMDVWNRMNMNRAPGYNNISKRTTLTDYPTATPTTDTTVPSEEIINAATAQAIINRQKSKRLPNPSTISSKAKVPETQATPPQAALPSMTDRSVSRAPWNPLAGNWIPKDVGPGRVGTASSGTSQETATNAWVRQYGEAKAKGDKIGMRHWQDLLETAGGEGRPQK